MAHTETSQLEMFGISEPTPKPQSAVKTSSEKHESDASVGGASGREELSPTVASRVAEPSAPAPSAPAPSAPAPPDLQLLNPPQAEAAGHIDGPLLVFAGAGSGKTRVITYRVANLVANHVPPYRILAVTFTNKAAGEMRHRLQALIGDELARDLWVGTFHSVCARLLRRHHDAAGLERNFVIYDDTDQRAVMNRVLKELKLDEKRYPPRQVLARIHAEKQEGRRPEEFERKNYADDAIAKCFEAYERHLAQANAADFDDLIVKVVRIVEDEASAAGQDLRKRFRYVLVDEFQDVNRVQYRLVRGMCAEHHNLCAVGDDDQSIYGWRGADVSIVRGFRRDLPETKVVKLEQNYRSTKRIVAAALAVIKNARAREPKELFTDNADGEPIAVVATESERDEAAFVVQQIAAAIETGTSPDEIAIFYRVHAQSRVLEEVLRAERIAYQVIGGQRFFERAEVKDLLSYLRVISNPKSDVDLLRIINKPSRKIGGSTIERLVVAADGASTSVYEAIDTLVAQDGIKAAPKKALLKFREMMRDLFVEAKTASPAEFAEWVIKRTGYKEMLEADDSPESEARALNLEELVGAIEEYEHEMAAAGEPASLDGYLERVTLASSLDEMDDQPKVALMTVHAAKGLEFEVVFVTGMEEDLFPFRANEPSFDADDEDEERRLAYVAVTRARQRLVITHASRRQIFGTTRYGMPSRFVRDLPAECINNIATTAARQGGGRFIDRPSSGFKTGAGGGRDGVWRHPQEDVARSMRTHVNRSHRDVEPGERFVERDDGVDAAALGIVEPRDLMGARVRHKTFGRGVVMGIDGGPDPTATVHFVGWPPKRIKVRFLEPE